MKRQHHDARLVQGGCYVERDVGHFKVIAVGQWHDVEVFVLGIEEDILVFSLETWPTLFYSPKLRHISDPASPEKGEGCWYDGKFYQVIMDGNNIEFQPCPMEGEVQWQPGTIH